MVRLEPESFLTALTKIYAYNAKEGSLRLTFKRYVPRKGELKGERCCLIRASGRGKKISTIVREKSRTQFQQGLADIMTIQMNGLHESREKERKRRKKKSVKKKRKKSTQMAE